MNVAAAREALVLTEPATGLTDLWASALHASGSLQQSIDLSIPSGVTPGPQMRPMVRRANLAQVPRHTTGLDFPQQTCSAMAERIGKHVLYILDASQVCEAGPKDLSWAQGLPYKVSRVRHGCLGYAVPR